MLQMVKQLEKGLILALVVMMAVVLLLATIELGWVILKDMITSPVLLLDVEELTEIFGLFMLVLIGIELLETIARTYAARTTNHAQIVMAVAIIAISRKVIIMDVKDLPGLSLLGLAAIILALAIGYILIKNRNGAGKERVAGQGGETPQ